MSIAHITRRLKKKSARQPHVGRMYGLGGAQLRAVAASCMGFFLKGQRSFTKEPWPILQGQSGGFSRWGVGGLGWVGRIGPQLGALLPFLFFGVPLIPTSLLEDLGEV